MGHYTVSIFVAAIVTAVVSVGMSLVRLELGSALEHRSSSGVPYLVALC
jgi:hypothetical protein